MRAFCLMPAFDTPNRKDASGAFQPEARKFVAANQLLVNMTLFDSNRALVDRRHESSRALARQTDLDVAAFFCHGWRDGLQAGWRLPQAQHLADLLVLASRAGSKVILYACDAARDADTDRADDRLAGDGGEGGMADAVALAMLQRGWRGELYAHTTAGHTTQNPHVRVWSATERGAWVVDPTSSLWPAWRAALKGDLRFRFPFLGREGIKAALVR